MKIILIGFMGSGKSSVAKCLSQTLGLPILEMDEAVFRKTRTKNMQDVFAKGGEFLLRKTEIAIAEECASIDNAIVSTGGGVVVNKIILDYLKNPSGKIFFLNATFQTIAFRLGLDLSRPLFKNIEDAESLYHFRHPLYVKYADHIIDVEKKPVEAIAKEISVIARGGQ